MPILRCPPVRLLPTAAVMFIIAVVGVCVNVAMLGILGEAARRELGALEGAACTRGINQEECFVRRRLCPALPLGPLTLLPSHAAAASGLCAHAGHHHGHGGCSHNHDASNGHAHNHAQGQVRHAELRVPPDCKLWWWQCQAGYC